MTAASVRGGKVDSKGRGDFAMRRLWVTGFAVSFAATLCAADEQAALLQPRELWRFAEFGAAISLDGNTLVVGARRNYDGRGSVFVFERDPIGANGWLQVAELLGPDRPDLQYFGDSAAVSGDTVLVTARGSAYTGQAFVYLFHRDETTRSWERVATLLELEQHGSPQVAIDGRTAFVAAPGNHDALGAVYVFEREQGDDPAWRMTARLLERNTGRVTRFGRWVSIDGDTLVVGAEGEAHVFERSTGSASWIRTVTLAGPELFGRSGAIDGDTIVIGVPDRDTVGSAWVFERDENDGPWHKTAELTPANAGLGSFVGRTVAIDGNTVAISSVDGIDGVFYEGAVFVYERDARASAGWQHVATLADPEPHYFDDFGLGLAVDDGLVVAGKPGDDEVQKNAGAAFVYLCDAWDGAVTGRCRASRCGDAIVDPPEACDDGNGILTDGCLDGEGGCVLARCGDGYVEATLEECDDGNQVDGDRCSSDCEVEPFCGDGRVDPGETCDDGNEISDDGCDDDCTLSGCPLFFDDMESGAKGWTHGILAEGAPKIADPATDSWSLRRFTCRGDDLGSTSYVSNGNDGPACTGASHERSFLLSPEVAIPTAGSAALAFSARSFDEGGTCLESASYDRHDVGVTTDGGATYHLLNDCTALADGHGTELRHGFDVSGFAGQTVRIIFTFDTIDTQHGHTFAVDNVVLWVRGCEPPADPMPQTSRGSRSRSSKR